MRIDSYRKKRSFLAMPPDVRWRLCPTVGDASKPLRATPASGRSPQSE
jgi:hypothetical protein